MAFFIVYKNMPENPAPWGGDEWHPFLKKLSNKHKQYYEKSVDQKIAGF